jgi:hypothetical protein
MGWVAAGSALLGAYASTSAANTQADAQDNASATQRGMFDTIQANSKPFVQAGYGATDTLSQLMGISGTPGSDVAGTNGLKNGYLSSTFNPTQAQLDQYPGYQFALKTGGQAVRNADTPGVGALSGAALKDLTNFNVGTANQYYGQYFNQDQTQKNSIYNRLSQIAGLGQSAAAGVGNSGTQLGTGIAQSQAAAGASQAAGTVGTANALSGGANSLAGLMYLNSGSAAGSGSSLSTSQLQGLGLGTQGSSFDAAGG